MLPQVAAPSRFRRVNEPPFFAPLFLALLVTVAATSGLGVAVGSLGLVLTDLHLVGNLVVAGVMAIRNINFPVSALPGWLQVVAHALPMTRGSAAAPWLLAGYGLFRYLERKAQVHGTLDLY